LVQRTCWSCDTNFLEILTDESYRLSFRPESRVLAFPPRSGGARRSGGISLHARDLVMRAHADEANGWSQAVRYAGTTCRAPTGEPKIFRVKNIAFSAP
jgi:hypothetical protein